MLNIPSTLTIILIVVLCLRNLFIYCSIYESTCLAPRCLSAYPSSWLSVMLVHSDEVLTLRQATADDIDDLTDLSCAALPLDPQWDYRFPRRKEYPEDNWKCTRSTYQTFMETPGYLINIITIPAEKDGGLVQRAVALAVWVLPEEERKGIISMGS